MNDPTALEIKFDMLAKLKPLANREAFRKLHKIDF